MLFTIKEIFDIIFMSAIVGYIFKDMLGPSRFLHKNKNYFYLEKERGWKDFWFSLGIVSIAIILHELGHKFTAMSFNLNAEFNAAYLWLFFGLLLKLLNFGFIFFVPAYVSITGTAQPLVFAATAFAGPLIHLLLWGISKIVLNNISNSRRNEEKRLFFFLSARINIFLFILNMLPIPGFDGFAVYSNLWKVVF